MLSAFRAALGCTLATGLGVTIQQVQLREKPIPNRNGLTYSKDIAPILNKHCVPCHRDGEVAPFSLANYESAKGHAQMIVDATQRRVMPPWQAVPGFGSFVDENYLTATQIERLRQWVQQGSARGDLNHGPRPTATNSNSEWKLGIPDLILQPETSFTLRKGELVSDYYRNYYVKNDSKEPLWVDGVEVLPGNKNIVHHVIVFLDSGGNAKRMAAQEDDGRVGYDTDGGGLKFLPSGSLGGWAPGVTVRKTPKDTAFLVPSGTDYLLQVHYHPNGIVASDHTRVGLHFRKTPPKREFQILWLWNMQIKVPANSTTHVERQQHYFDTPATLYAVMPHMHKVARSIKAWLEFPNGTIHPLVHVDGWDFKWQHIYYFKSPIQVPKGAVEVVEIRYDNSVHNPSQPNEPVKDVVFGGSTKDEMFLLLNGLSIDRP